MFAKSNGLPTLQAKALLALACFVGCGSEKLPITGTVTVDGAPVDRGLISFQSAGGSGPTSGTQIEEGRFSLAADHGLLPGEYKVSVQALRRTGKTVRDPQRGDVEEFLPIALKSPSTSLSISEENANQVTLDLPGLR